MKVLSIDAWGNKEEGYQWNLRNLLSEIQCNFTRLS